MYDCLIIGAGPAGISAAIYLARKKLNILLLTQDSGGQTVKAASVENYLGFPKISGAELFQKFQAHLEELKVETKDKEAKKISPIEGGFEIESAEIKYQTKTVLIASGKTPKHLDVPGEEKFSGKGVSYCATCDAPLFQDKTVVVVGGGNSALDAACELEKYAKEVIILNLNSEIMGDAILKDRFCASGKGRIINEGKTTEIYGPKGAPSGRQFVRGLKYQDLKSGENKDLPCQGIFVEIGWTPSTYFVRGFLKLTQMGEIEADKTGVTSVQGIFAAGDVTDTPFNQIIIAAGDGARAALSAWKYLITKN